MATKASYEPVESAQGLLPGHPSRQTKRTRKSTLSLGDTWTWEILCVVIGVVLIVVLCLVLHRYDGKTAPQFGEAFDTSLTLNTVVSIIVTGARAALLLPVAECVGQLKWIWFAKDYRPLSDVSTFDKASRGILGGFGLSWRTKLSNVAALGLFVMLLQIAIDPLSQQLIKFRIDRAPTAGLNATIGIAQNFNDETTASSGAMAIPPSLGSVTTNRIKNAVQMGINSANVSLADIAPLCPGGNCTFNPYWSLAVCTRFANVSDHLSENTTSEGFRHYLSESHYIAHSVRKNVFMNMSSATGPIQTLPKVETDDRDPLIFTNSFPDPLNFTESIAFRDISDPIADTFIIVRGDDAQNDPQRYAAIEFVLEWCVQNFTTMVTNGTATTQRHNAIRGFTGGYRKSLGPTLNLTLDGINYEVFAAGHNRLQRYMQLLFSGNVYMDMSENWYATSDAMQLLFEPWDVFRFHHVQAMELGFAGTKQAGLERMINNVATGLTDYIRNLTWSSDTRSSGYTPPVNGIVYHQVSIVDIRWKWIAGHILFAVLSSVLLFLTIIHQQSSPLRAKPWKSSSAAVLHALDPALQQELKGILSQSEMDSQDIEVLVRLLPTDDGGWRLMTREKKEGTPLETL